MILAFQELEVLRKMSIPGSFSFKNSSNLLPSCLVTFDKGCFPDFIVTGLKLFAGHDGSNVIHVQIYDGEDIFAADSDANAVPQNEWVHLGFSYEYTTGTRTLYSYTPQSMIWAPYTYCGSKRLKCFQLEQH